MCCKEKGEEVMRSLQKWLAVFIVIALCAVMMAGCGKKEEDAAAGGEETSGETYKACFITDGNLGNDFVDLIWKGFQNLEQEGWEIKCIEATDNSEFADDIRSDVYKRQTGVCTGVFRRAFLNKLTLLCL